MNTVRFVLAAGALLAVSACAGNNSTVLRMSNVWSTTCGTGSAAVVVSAPTLSEFHAAVEKTPECAHGYTANAPIR